jgi:hypothetical protein
MISEKALFQLVPKFYPSLEFDFDKQILDLNYDSPVRNIALWSAYVRHQMRIQAMDIPEFRSYIERAGFVGSGILRTPRSRVDMNLEGFPIIDGYQFGVVILHSDITSSGEGKYNAEIAIRVADLMAPVVEFQSGISLHLTQAQGHVAALFKDSKNDTCGVTAAHVVNGFRTDQRVSIFCSDCGSPATLVRKAPGLLDAAIVKFPCGGALYKYSPTSIKLRPAFEGETVSIYFGRSGVRKATVMLSLQTPTDILSAAAPKHFLVDEHGNPGDSGSLVATLNSSPDGDHDLLGIYLGETDCEDGNQRMITYGFALELKQVCHVFRILISSGEFNE